MDFPLKAQIKSLFQKLPSKVKVQDRYVGEGCPVFVIAEIGNNHNGEFDLAIKTIAAAKEAGAHAVKFQKRNVEAVFTKEMRDMPYDNPRSLAPTYGEHREKLEFNKEQFLKLKDFAEKLGLIFFVTPFDESSVDFLEEIGVHAYKIASFDVTNISLLTYVAKKNKPILLSSGLSTLEEIDQAVHTILSHNNRLIVNHCTSIYPTPDAQIHLNVMRTLAQRYHPLPVGYSGHEPDIFATVIAAAMGARTVERHFTLDKKMRGSDHHMSIEPQEFRQMVSDIERVDVIQGSYEKQIHAEEIPVRHKHTKSIVAKLPIRKGEKIGAQHLTFKSPGTGIKPIEIDSVIGRVAQMEIEIDTVIPVEALTWSRS